MLVCEDDPAVRRLLQLVLGRRAGHTVVLTATAEEAVEEASSMPPDAVLCDFLLGGRTAFDLVAEMRTNPDLVSVPVLLLTGADHVAADPRLTELGIVGVLRKPFEVARLAEQVEEAVASHAA